MIYDMILDPSSITILYSTIYHLFILKFMKYEKVDE